LPDIEIKRGYEVLPDNNIRFGIRITNISDLAIFDVEVILDFPETLFKLEGERLQKIGVIPSASARTAEFVLKPLGCVHKVNIEALITYRDAKSKKYRIDMHPKEVHCVCPFLKGKKMPKLEFLELSGAGHSAEMGLNFKGVTVERLTSFLVQTCKSRHYKVDDFSIDGGRMLYLASESIGEKAYYLLTALIKEEDDLTQVMLRAVSDKPHGLNGFLNETVADLRHVVSAVRSAQEIGVIKKEQVINIIDSVVQRTTFAGGEGGASVNIKDSVVQRTEFKGDEERKRREEERRSKEREEQERLRREREEDAQAQREKEDEERRRREEEERAREEAERRRIEEEQRREKEDKRARIEQGEKSSGGKWFYAVIIIFGVLALGWYGTQDSNNPAISTPQKTTSSVTTTPVMTSKATPSVAAVVTASADQKTYTNSIGMEFVMIPAGEFDMGSPSNEKNRDSDEGPVHRVKISNAFYMGKYEVTQKQWRDVMGNNPSSDKGDNRPVEMVSWNDVQDFIKKLNEKEGGNKYRLPSEAEWEYALRAGTKTRYSFGDDESNLGDYAWYYSNSGGITRGVGQKKPNLWGLYDMHGNVWEMVQDNWHSDYSGAPTDGSAWEGSGSVRVVRGGWLNTIEGCRSANRDELNPGRFSDVGFRLVRDV